jgi:PAS domain S-box-containing protein
MNGGWIPWKGGGDGMHQSRFLRYGAAVLMPVLAVVLIYTRPVLMQTPFYIFMAAVMITATYAGLAPAFVATALSVFLVRLLFIQPYFYLYYKGNILDAERLCWFALLALMLSSLVAGLRREKNYLRESEERYRILAESASDAIIVIDEKETIRFVNPVAEKLFGADAQQLLGQNLALLLPDATYQGPLEELKHHLDSRKPALVLQLPGRNFAGKNLLIEMTLGSFAKHGQSLFTAILREIRLPGNGKEKKQSTPA